MNDPNIPAGLSEPFKALITSPALVFQVFDTFPIPIEIFTPDGMSVYVNRAALDLHHIPDASLIVGKYNMRADPVCREIFGQEALEMVFRGEAGSAHNIPAPAQDHVDRGIVDEKPFDAAVLDVYALPVWDGDTFLYLVTVFVVKRIYTGRADIDRAQAYIRENWLAKFDLEAAAAAAGLGSRHLRRIFKEATGGTLFEYYQKVKLEKIQEHLLDDSFSVRQAFTACGAAPNGAYLRLFEEKTGMTPSEYRKKR
jgi:AraC-like DNA-binding protein